MMIVDEPIPHGPPQMVRTWLTVKGMLAFMDGHSLPTDAPRAFIEGWNRMAAFKNKGPAVAEPASVEVLDADRQARAADWGSIPYCRAETSIGQRCNRGGRYDGLCYQHARISKGEKWPTGQRSASWQRNDNEPYPDGEYDERGNWVRPLFDAPR